MAQLYPLTPPEGHAKYVAELALALYTSPLSVRPHPHACASTDFPVSASVSRGENTGLFDESVRKQPGLVYLGMLTHTPTRARTYTR